MEEVLRLENVNVTYGNRGNKVYAVQDASLILNKGDSMGIVGESGSGKSTLANAVLRLLNEETAEVTGHAWFGGEGGKDVLAISREEMNEFR